MDTTRWELLGVVGSFAALISGVQVGAWSAPGFWSELGMAGMGWIDTRTEGLAPHFPDPACQPGHLLHAHTSLQASVLEHSAWTSGHWDGAAAGALAGFAVALYSFAVLLPSVLMWGGSTVLNLSLLTSDLWAAGSR